MSEGGHSSVVERLLAKEKVAGSNLVARSPTRRMAPEGAFFVFRGPFSPKGAPMGAALFFDLLPSQEESVVRTDSHGGRWYAAFTTEASGAAGNRTSAAGMLKAT